MQELERVQRRIDALESEQSIRYCINRYMDLCDRLSLETPFDELGELFTQDAIWQGKGARYAKSFGGYAGREEIVNMLKTYATNPPHFALNVHYLSSEVIRVDGDSANASWNMIQVSTFNAGGSHLNSARLSVTLSRKEGMWRISCFQTENLFSRPISDWNSEAELPVPESK
ncbi:nuclear transport factor 2 family protein [Vibrio sp.]|nr:nuclear transport factor 2 family protein [Vibrio sp.]